MNFVGGFAFAEAINDATTDGKPDATMDVTVADTPIKKPAGDVADPAKHYLTITANGAASLPATNALIDVTSPAAGLRLDFMVTKTGAATVTVKFHEWVPPTTDVDVTVPGAYKDPVIRVLRFSVVAVTQKPKAL